MIRRVIKVVHAAWRLLSRAIEYLRQQFGWYRHVGDGEGDNQAIKESSAHPLAEGTFAIWVRTL